MSHKVSFAASYNIYKHPLCLSHLFPSCSLSVSLHFFSPFTFSASLFLVSSSGFLLRIVGWQWCFFDLLSHLTHQKPSAVASLSRSLLLFFYLSFIVFYFCFLHRFLIFCVFNSLSLSLLLAREYSKLCHEIDSFLCRPVLCETAIKVELLFFLLCCCPEIKLSLF